MECPKCKTSVTESATLEQKLEKFYPRHAGRGFWVCLECNRAFHEEGIRVS
jgi:uncharacterized protein with PIN domain